MSARPEPGANSGSLVPGTSSSDARTAAMLRGNSNGSRPSGGTRPVTASSQAASVMPKDTVSGAGVQQGRQDGGTVEVDVHDERAVRPQPCQ